MKIQEHLPVSFAAFSPHKVISPIRSGSDPSSFFKHGARVKGMVHCLRGGLAGAFDLCGGVSLFGRLWQPASWALWVYFD